MKRILIAGVSGAIGQALAEHYLTQDDGLQIIGLCRNPLAVKFDATFAERVQLVAWDAAASTDPARIASDLEQVLATEDGLDGVIYAAGFLHGQGIQPEKRLEDLDAGAMAHSFAVNATGFAVLMRALAPWLRHRRFKTVVAISAKVGSITDNGFGGWYAYRSSKAALNMLVRNVSIELPRKCRPVACVAIHPGTTLSPLSEPFSRSLAQLKVHQPAETAANIAGVIDGLSQDNNGQFLSWDGSLLPW
ncbi:SDR family NAD(P)-dependent oxidoreductase [Marinobacter confluentis]|uniref:SDR family NAD(P)-dependent oxidoreductase n=1 Tax=Marinobacter confluentis TaxID=1697557 RepID=A0A4Z1BG29_9GAMM|nr:SDR family NAD(P)-dependent oxidoreductase [Marinobacter confluentis]TGN38285.1 SDR family NAD(P)-dependent oxidoreductase [Marinobacter confluentis]